VSQQPLITTVIPTYRRPKLLRRAIQSVLNQTYPHFLVCVYDNASGDETEAVVAEFARRDPRVRYYRHAENIGLARNFTYGAAQVTTPFLNFLSDDDLLLPIFFETAIAAFKRHPRAAMFLGNLIVAAADGTTLDIPAAPWREGLHEAISAFSLWTQAPLTWTSSVLKSEALQEIGGLDASIGEPLDIDLMIKITCRFPVTSTSLPCAVFFLGGASFRTNLRYWSHSQERTTRTMESDPTFDPIAREKIASRMRNLTTQSAFQIGLSNAARLGLLDDANTAADVLELHRAPSVRVRLAALFGSNSIAGRTARWAFRIAHKLRTRRRRFVNFSLYRRSDALVREVLAATRYSTNEDTERSERSLQCSPASRG
jgi:glycosyltransferase involved in cell wall biosynthesis